MTKARIAVALCVLVAVACAAGYLWGKRSVPVRVEVRTKEVIQWREKIVKVASTQQTESSKANERIVTRWRTLPSGEKVTEQSRESASSASAAVVSASSATTDASGTSNRATESTRLIVYPPVRKWGVSAIAGVDLKLNKQFGLQVQRDIGPFNVGVWALSSKTAGVSVGFRF